MKKFATLLMLLTVSLFSLGCTPAEEDVVDGGVEPVVDADVDGAEPEVDVDAPVGDADTVDDVG